jgi:hypothetical protein
MIRLLTIIALMSLAALPARAQITGSLDWSALGLADEAAIPSGATAASAAVTSTR